VGCLESYCSGWALAQRGKEWRRLRRESFAYIGDSGGKSAEGITAKEIVLAASQGDPEALHIVQDAARWLARGLLTVIRILDPDRIILGGGLTLAGQILLVPLHQSLKELASPTIGYSTEIVTAELGLYSPLYGAAAMALDLMSRQ
jgi:glucokinase